MVDHKQIIYLDHAATSWPKPPQVAEAMIHIMNGAAASSGRGNHRMALQAGRILYGTRIKLAKMFNVNNPNDIVFTANTTIALNMAIKGLLKPGDHVIATMVEHNSVRRPIEYLRRTQGVTVDYVPVTETGEISLNVMESLFRNNTKLVVCSHSSNLLGSILPIKAISKLAHDHGAIMLLDAAQTAGLYPVDAVELGVDMLAFPGHKGLLGPQGTGGLYIAPHVDLEPILHGGTGSQSEEPEQPLVRPDRYEAGTVNTPGIAGLGAALDVVLGIGVQQIYLHEWKLTQYLMERLEGISGISIIGPERGIERTGIVSFNLKGYDAADVAYRLDKEYGIAVRAGYHCTPLGHMSAGTKDNGAVRVSVGYHTTTQELDALIHALNRISKP